MDREDFIKQYKKLKTLNKEKSPLYRDFLNFCGIHRRKLDAVYGKDAYSKLQEECGDSPNRLLMERTPISQILDQYGELVRINSGIPVIADWTQAKLKPSVEGISRVHNIKWSEIPNIFIKEYAGKPEWKDVIKIIGGMNGNTTQDRTNRAFNEIVDKILGWIPDRKRIVEEGYKIELRNYLEKYFDIEEEVGETNIDLLLNNKYPIEIKKDPSQSEYDRLLGQMIRHNKLYGNAIAVVASISSEDRFKKFQKLFIEVHNKLGMTAELIKK
ncbi:MAG: hypothetical protein QM610_15790 [Chitinophagaceae bacterium]